MVNALELIHHYAKQDVDDLKKDYFYENKNEFFYKVMKVSFYIIWYVFFFAFYTMAKIRNNLKEDIKKC
jgi:heme/copper-type cytochrome/quinol oxidase subunit 2